MTVVELLKKAERSKRTVTDRLQKTPEALRGIDDLLAYLDHARQKIESSQDLSELRLFVARAQEDIEVGVVAVFNGMIAVAVDACRDIMEMEMLLREFVAEPSLVEKWYTKDERERLRYFRPALLREKRAKREGVDVKGLQDSVDYSNHSAGLHVSPIEMLWRRGVVEKPRPWLESDFAIAEIIDHSGRFIEVLFNLAQLRHEGTIERPESASDFLTAVDLVRSRFVPEYRKMVNQS
jgi:hypothetical protein